MAKEIDDLKGKYKNERIFVIGNGPSLSQTPISNINNEFSFGMNKINKIYSETSWRPDFYFNTCNPTGETKNFVKQNAESGSLCFLPSEFSKQYQGIGNCYFLNPQPLKRDRCFDDMGINQLKNISVRRLSQYWSDNIKNVVYTYHSMYAVLQIVAYLGFNEVYLLGCDLGYGKNSPHMLFDTGQDPIDYVDKGDSKKYDHPKISYLMDAIKSRNLGRCIVNGILFKILSSKADNLASAILSKVGIASDKNHFTDEYGYKPIDLTDINKEIIKGHVVSKRMYNDRQKRIFNSTLGGNLEIYPRVEFDQITK